MVLLSLIALIVSDDFIFILKCVHIHQQIFALNKFSYCQYIGLSLFLEIKAFYQDIFTDLNGL